MTFVTYLSQISEWYLLNKNKGKEILPACMQCNIFGLD